MAKSFLRLPPLSRRRFLAASAAGVAAAGLPPRAAAATEMRDRVSQHGVTFRFSEPRPVGRYATGDWFVQAPVEIVEITPASVRTTDAKWLYRKNRKDRVIHGAQLDYLEDRHTQALDDIMSDYRWKAFVPEANVDPGFSGRPLRVENPATLIKVVSLPAEKVGRQLRPCLADMLFLTVVDEIPPAGAFRPSPEPGDKRSRWSEADLDWSILPRLPRPAGLEHVWDFEKRARLNIRPHWNAHARHDFTRQLMAKNNQHSYGREHSWETAYGALALCADAPRAAKRDLFVGLIQQGLDLYEMIAAGRRIKAADGNSLGRALPLVIAATALKDTDLRAAADAKNFTVSEHGQFFHVGDDVIGKPRISKDRSRGPYTEDMRGIPEFGGQHIGPGGGLMQPGRSGSHYEMSYRNIVSNPTFAAGTAAHAIGKAVEIWNQPALFDYLDRWHGIVRTKSSGDTRKLYFGNGPSAVALACWEAWRDRSPHPRHLARPEVMLQGRSDRELGVAYRQGAPILVPRVGGLEVHPLLNPHRDSSLDARSVYEVRISRDAKTWSEVGEITEPALLRGLERGTRYYVQMRQVHPEHGAGPWSFDWVWWRENLVFEGRYSADGRNWTEAGEIGHAAEMFAWLSQTHRRKAPRVEIRSRQRRRNGKERVSGWKAPFWLHPELDFEPPAAGLGELRRNEAYPPSAVTF